MNKELNVDSSQTGKQNNGKKISDFFKGTGEKIKDFATKIKETDEGKKALHNAFIEQSQPFLIIYNDPSKKEKKIRCILDVDKKTLRTDEKIMKNEVKCIKDSFTQEHYITYIKEIIFSTTHNQKEYNMKLFEIEYSTTNLEKNEAYSTFITNIDNSITAGKGAIVGENNKKETTIKAGVNFPDL